MMKEIAFVLSVTSVDSARLGDTEVFERTVSGPRRMHHEVSQEVAPGGSWRTDFGTPFVADSAASPEAVSVAAASYDLGVEVAFGALPGIVDYPQEAAPPWFVPRPSERDRGYRLAGGHSHLTFLAGGREATIAPADLEPGDDLRRELAPGDEVIVFSGGPTAYDRVHRLTVGPSVEPDRLVLEHPWRSTYPVALAAGWEFSLLVRRDGSLWSWGRNQSGQLGLGNQVNTNVPQQVPGATGVATVAAGFGHAVFLDASGTVWTCGTNGMGQLGSGEPAPTIRTLFAPVAGLTGIVAIASGQEHVIALRDDNTLWSWGRGIEGQLGNGGWASQFTPVQVVGLPAGAITMIAACGTHSLVMMADGTVWAFGLGLSGQLGNGAFLSSNVPVQVSGIASATRIAAGILHSLVLLSDGTVWAFGHNGYGQLGDGTANNSAVPVQVTDPADATGFLQGAVAVYGGGKAGEARSFARKSDGTVGAWGSDDNGGLGDGPPEADQMSPVLVAVPQDFPLVSLATGGGHTIGVSRDGAIFVWGENYHGQLGIGVTDPGGPASNPTPIQMFGPVTLTRADHVYKVFRQGAGLAARTEARFDGQVHVWNTSGQTALVRLLVTERQQTGAEPVP